MEEPEHRLSPDVLQQLTAKGGLRRLAAGEALFNEGEISDSLCVLLEGQLKVYSCNENGREVVYNVLDPGEILGEMLLDGGPRSASVKAVIDSQCLIVQCSEIRGLMRAHPDFAESLVLTLVARLRTATRKIRSLALDGVYERVIELLEHASQADGELRRIPRNLTQLEIANRIGATREMVNHVLRELVRGGFILKDAQHRMTIVRKLPKHW
jgi:CRP/FNR family transcriptional regulator, cyclic AMP receptor protein